ncbi:unnamed protein product [Effrenium voratum]|nr:unnamed protein product [Effrenium voratum]
MAGGIIRPAGSRADLDTKSDVDRLFKAVVGVFWTPDKFLTKASSIARPRCLMAGLPESLKAAIRANVFASDEDLGRERTPVLRRWLSLAFKLRDEEQTMRAAMPAHGESIARGKRLALFRELLREINHPDALLTDQICKGYDLTGPIPASGVFKTKFTFAEMSVEELRATAELRSRGILASVKSSGDTSLDEELHKITLQELEKGWLEGPVSPEALPRGATVSRRFGIWQGGNCRPIDNLTESLINSTCSSCEGISVHTADVIGGSGFSHGSRATCRHQRELESSVLGFEESAQATVRFGLVTLRLVHWGMEPVNWRSGDLFAAGTPFRGLRFGERFHSCSNRVVGPWYCPAETALEWVL